jgi:hypothetical protein
VRDEHLPLEQAIPPVTLKAARLLRLDGRNGPVRAGFQTTRELAEHLLAVARPVDDPTCPSGSCRSLLSRM